MGSRARLLQLLVEHSFRKRRVVLASGRESDVFIDCKQTVLTAEGHALVGEVMLDALRALEPCAAVAGVELGGCPLASAVALVGIGKSGAIAALGDTLYPAQSVLGGLAQDVSPTAHFLVQLRIAHPILALAGALLVAFAASRVLQATDDAGVRDAAWAVSALALLQLGGGLLNLALLAPVWMQIVHLLGADLLWIAFVLLAVRALSLPLPAPVKDGTLARASAQDR